LRDDRAKGRGALRVARSGRPRCRVAGRRGGHREEGCRMRRLCVMGVVLALGCQGARGDSQKASDAGAAPAPTIDVVKVVAKPLDTVMHLDGELAPYEAVSLHARANGFVSRVLVDRG